MAQDPEPQDTLPIQVEEVSPFGIIKTEANLSWLPFFALSRQDVRDRIQTEYKVVTERDGEQVKVLWSVTANAKHGYPGPFDRRVHKAIEYIINDRGIPVENPVPFSLYQIMKILGVRLSGMMRQRIKQSLIRIFSASVTSEGTFYSKSKKQYISDNFHIYDRVVFKEQTLPNGATADTNYLFLSQWYLDSINAFYVRPIDFDYYQQLQSDVAGRLYELLGSKFHGVIANKKHCWKVKYQELCGLLPITEQRYLSLAQRTLAPAHNELIETHFLAEVVWNTTDNEQWALLYYPGKRARDEIKPKAIQEKLPLRLPASSGPADSSSVLSTLTPEEQELFALLKSRKIGQKSGLAMVRAYPERIKEKIAAFDWLMRNSQEKIQSPTGFLRRMIEEDWPAPEGFVSPSEQEEQARKAEVRHQQLQQQEDTRRAVEAVAEQAQQERRDSSPWKEVWEQIADHLAQQMPRQSFSTWIQPLFIADLHDEAIVIDCPSRFLKEYVEERYRSVIEEAVATVCGAEKQVILAYTEDVSHSRGL